MVKNKRHLEVIHQDRVLLQHEYHLWLKNYISIEMIPEQMLLNIVELSVSHYSAVRIMAQNLLNKLLLKTSPDGHAVVLDKVLECLKPGTNEERFKGALYVLLDDSMGFFGLWKNLARVLPSLVRAQGSDKNSIIELLKDHSARCSRNFGECIIFTMAVTKPVPTNALREALSMTNQGTVTASTEVDPDFLKLEAELCDLILNGNLHWRHYEMAVGMLYSVIVPGYQVSHQALKVWLNCLTHDDRNIRFVAFQAVECLLKMCKSKRKAVYEEPPSMASTNPHFLKPGLREDNTWLQYKSELQSDEKALEAYWSKPFIVKQHIGFYGWPKNKLKMRIAEDCPVNVPSYMAKAVLDYFDEEQNLDNFMKFVTMEHKKGEDFFNPDRGYFYAIMFELFAKQLYPKMLPRLKKLVESDQESEQRAAAEIMYGIVHGTRFHSYSLSKEIATDLKALMRSVFANVTAETVADWETFIVQASTKVDPNRLGWLYELLMEEVQTIGSSGAFKEATILRMMNKAIVQNWRGRDLHMRTYQFLTDNFLHPYQKVRYQIAKLLAEVLTFDVKYCNTKNPKDPWSLAQGFPKCKDFIEFVLPKLSLNFHNPELQGIVAQNGEDTIKVKGGGGTSGIFVESNQVFDSPMLSSNSKGAIQNMFGIDLDEDSKRRCHWQVADDRHRWRHVQVGCQRRSHAFARCPHGFHQRSDGQRERFSRRLHVGVELTRPTKLVHHHTRNGGRLAAAIHSVHVSID